MNCRQVDKYLYDYCDNILNPEQRAQIEQHLEQCPDCRKLSDEALLESSILHEEWPIPALSDDFTARVMNRISSTAIPTSPVVIIPGLKNQSKWPRRLIYLSAMAAVLLMALYIPGMLKNQDFIHMADQEQNSPRVVNERIIAGQSLSDQNYLKLPAGLNWEEKINEARTKKAQEETSPPDTSKTNTIPEVQTVTASHDAIKQSQDVNIQAADVYATPQLIPVQPVNLPASYVLLNKVDTAGASTYTFGTLESKELIINIAQLPLRQSGISSYSRGYIRETAAPETTEKKELKLDKQVADQSVEEQSAGGISSMDEAKAAVADVPATNTMSYELEFNNQKFLLTISANLSPEELSILSRDLQLASTNP